MRAAIFEGEGRVEIKDVPEPRVERPDDVIVRVAANGICGTDLIGLKVPPDVIHYAPGIVVGHEFVGVVEEVGDESPFAPGERVAVHPNLYCGQCWYCRNGSANVCDNLRTIGLDLDGGTAEFARVPSYRVFPIPDELPFERAVLAEPLACVLNGTRKAALHPGESVVILGGGPIGALFLATLEGAGAHPIVVSEPGGRRRQSALDLGADSVVDPTVEDLEKIVRELTDGVGADVVIDTVGFLAPEGFSLLRKRGRMLIFGGDLTTRETSFIDFPRLEARVEGVFCGNDNFPLAIRLLAENSMRFERLVAGGKFSLEDFDAAIASARGGDVLKAVISIDEAAVPVDGVVAAR